MLLLQFTTFDRSPEGVITQLFSTPFATYGAEQIPSAENSGLEISYLDCRISLCRVLRRDLFGSANGHVQSVSRARARNLDICANEFPARRRIGGEADIGLEK